MDIKDIIREKRLELGLTYEQLGNIVGVGKSTVRKWETGMIENMRRDSIVALSHALDISPALIMGWDREENQSSKNNKLLSEEQFLLSNFNKLNDLGKKEANKRVSELTELSIYVITKEEYNFAAHDDGLDPEKAKKRLTKAREIFKQMDEKK
ncbi:helix-turn-helix domain-containing protein [Clostridium estertheticum]|uniref:helix-turn-helix domain-containing protein n=1 Tax=Clostridium estertheticum TaxID=238834 RepID=UPI001C0DBE1A|nr:helix-turn-helix transcriptional regulator [Clostridium estertheticum]MBU3171385.1 helix-turn-helix domain-containing protein [Clostridium estertheticum]